MKGMIKKRISGGICAVILLVCSVNIRAGDAGIPVLQSQIALLEAAVDRSTPEKVSEQWAKAQMTRNGALEYALLSEKLRSERLADYEAFRFVMGTSSPWVESFLITQSEEQADGSYLVAVELCRTTSTRERSYGEVILTIEKDPREIPVDSESVRWCVASVQLSGKGAVAGGLLVSVDDKEIVYDVVKISEGGTVYERGVSFGSMARGSVTGAASGSSVQLRFYSTATGLNPPGTPTSAELYECELTPDGEIKYNEETVVSVPLTFTDGTAAFVLEPSPDAHSNADSAGNNSEAALMGFRLLCRWEDKSCEYIFVLNRGPVPQ